MKIHQHTRTHKGLCHTTDPVVGHSHVPVLIFFFSPHIFVFRHAFFLLDPRCAGGGHTGDDLPCSHSQKSSYEQGRSSLFTFSKVLSVIPLGTH